MFKRLPADMVFSLDETPADPFAIYKVHFPSSFPHFQDSDSSANPPPPSNLVRSEIVFPRVAKPPPTDEDYAEQFKKQKLEEVKQKS